MSPFLIETLHVAVLAIEFIVFVILSNSFFQLHSSPLKIVGICFVAFVANYGFLAILGQYIVLKLLVGCIVFVLIAKLLFSISIVYCFFVSIIYLSLVNLVDNAVLFLISLAIQQNISNLMVDPYMYYLLAFSAKLVEVAAVAVVHAWGKRRFYKRVSSAWNYVKFSIFPIISLICTVALLNTVLGFPQTAPQLLLCNIALLISNFVIIIFLDRFENQQQAILDNRVLQQELKSAHDSIVSLSASYSNERRLTHDFQNKLTVIQGLLLQDQGLNATKVYVNELLSQDYAPSFAITTRRTVVDVLLSHKYNLASQKQIKLQVQLDDLSKFPLPDDALVVVLSNLIDNAIEACEKILDEQKRCILIKAHVGSSGSILCVENSVASPVPIINGYIKTTKGNPLQHGYGLQNISAIVSAHEGTYAIHCDEENLKFIFVIHFNSKNQ